VVLPREPSNHSSVDLSAKQSKKNCLIRRLKERQKKKAKGKKQTALKQREEEGKRGYAGIRGASWGKKRKASWLGVKRKTIKLEAAWAGHEGRGTRKRGGWHAEQKGEKTGGDQSARPEPHESGNKRLCGKTGLNKIQKNGPYGTLLKCA